MPAVTPKPAAVRWARRALLVLRMRDRAAPVLVQLRQEIVNYRVGVARGDRAYALVAGVERALRQLSAGTWDSPATDAAADALRREQYGEP